MARAYKGQFEGERAIEHWLAAFAFFAAPVTKDGGEIHDPDAHLSWYYLLPTTEVDRRVTIKNQFDPDEQEIVLGRPWALLVPTRKEAIVTESDGRLRLSEFPEELDHFKVYRVREAPPITRGVELADQFSTGSAKVTRLHYFAVPVIKKHKGEETPIQHETNHLAIYDLHRRPLRRSKWVRVFNQFFDGYVRIKDSLGLAVPTAKLGWEVVR